MNRSACTALSLLLVLGLAGCLLSLTESFDYDVTAETGDIVLTGTNGQVEAIDLRDDDTFEEHQDDIKNIDRVGFEADLYTENDKDSVIDIDFRRDSSQEWMLLLEGAQVSAGSSSSAQDRIEYADSEKLIRNFEEFQKLAEGGVMELRMRATDGNDQVTITHLLLVVTITAGK